VADAAKAPKAGRRKIRAIWRKLDCLKSNPQTVAVRTHRKGVCNRCHALHWPEPWAGATSGVWAMPNEGIQGDEWNAYVALDTYNRDVPRDRLRGESPKVTEFP
jgi:hypothetical protein